MNRRDIDRKAARTCFISAKKKMPNVIRNSIAFIQPGKSPFLFCSSHQTAPFSTRSSIRYTPRAPLEVYPDRNLRSDAAAVYSTAAYVNFCSYLLKSPMRDKPHRVPPAKTASNRSARMRLRQIRPRVPEQIATVRFFGCEAHSVQARVKASRPCPFMLVPFSSKNR